MKKFFTNLSIVTIISLLSVSLCVEANAQGAYRDPGFGGASFAGGHVTRTAPPPAPRPRHPAPAPAYRPAPPPPAPYRPVPVPAPAPVPVPPPHPVPVPPPHPVPVPPPHPYPAPVRTSIIYSSPNWGISISL